MATKVQQCLRGEKKYPHIWGVGSYTHFCKNRLSQFGNCVVLENVQKSKMNVP